MLLPEVQVCYPKHRGIQTASLKAWVECQAWYIRSRVKILYQGPVGINSPAAHALLS